MVLRQSEPLLALVASAVLLAGCGGERIIAAYAVEKKTGEWCAVSEQAEANALSAGSAYYPGRVAALHFRESVLAWIEYVTDHQDDRIRDTYSIDSDYKVSRLTRTGLFGDDPKLYVWYQIGEHGCLSLTPKARRNIRAHKTAGYRAEWLSSPIYSTFDAMPFSDTVRIRSMRRTIKRAC